MEDQLTQLLEPIAAQFRSLGIPEPITHWGHPVMMGTVIFVMGGYVAYAGWQGRLNQDAEQSAKYRGDHRKLAPWMFLFLAMGYTGGILSLVMQHHAILESPHFWTGSIALGLLTLTSGLSFFGFGGDLKSPLRTVHAYLGAGIMLLLVVHTVLGINLGLSL
ncbi:MAG: DUF4079 domain-containing protein [Microcystaceae cyanobacterium]|nr:DUF4079 domain-containing protein [Merismopediaceae bacterium]